MTKQELENRIFNDDEFIGTEQNKKNADRFNAMVTVAQALGKSKRDFTSVTCDDVNDPHHRNCSIYMNLREVGYTNDSVVKDGLKILLNECDDVSYSILGGNLRISFGVYDVWSDGVPFERLGFVSKDEEEDIERMVDDMVDDFAEADKMLNKYSEDELSDVIDYVFNGK